MKNNLLLVIIISLAVGAGAFFGGMKYQQIKQPLRNDFQSMREMRQAGNIPAGLEEQSGRQGGMIRGEIISQDKEGITVKLVDDSSKIILVSKETEINKATKATMDDLTIGEQIMVFGKTNSDGSVSASQIQLNFEPKREQ
ncbi:hypothetical protein COT75_03960 [Candidatus Beckwithbacteria bacterium CG10_big_fil_rev_8_21_14_0_10_34_10]|uniref:DUF5666 domain-containing protein n=1 Tax=Candidatus Beckwithbacteria bacterium CG10_big_fil_rev_8_21_14_0_10_34_10 TaxID=1974495 RepID=A0A2H0WAR2_9BACT|nr:MAG: hypothetical protein COT75_03960 [Candidatus Beckwithbacteria bacterium CG10_big_fil_rev_8_21_14_0_10_34_10]